MKSWIIDRALLLLTALAFVGAMLFLGRWLGSENLYSAMTAITIVALWFRVAHLTKLLRENGIDPNTRRNRKDGDKTQRD